MKKLISTLLIACLAILIACGGEKNANASSDAPKATASTSTSDSKDTAASDTNRKGKLIYKQYCVICHGSDGSLMVSGATDLSKSTVSMEESINQITNGKGLMTPYKDILSTEANRFSR